MRKRPGIGAIQKQRLEQEKYRDKSNVLQENQLEQMEKQLQVFHSKLEDFAHKHRHEIKKDAQFRRQFQEMCASIGVDPLASTKGFWASLGIGDFYNELTVQVVEVCLATSSKNGGIIHVDELRKRLVKTRRKSKQASMEINNDDIRWAASKLRIFGNGLTVIEATRNNYFIQSVPGELSLDHTALLQLASSENTAFISVSIVTSRLNWERLRAEKALNHMIKEGLAWMDSKNRETLYWFPSMFAECIESS